MTRKHFPAPSAEVERVLAMLKTIDLSAPLTGSELAAFNASRAKEMAKAEARRLPHPQGEIEV